MVVHCKVERYDVYVGRPSKWGNPFRRGTKEENIEQHKEWLMMGDGMYLLPQLKELKGKTLGCWCSPSKCHADTLYALANQDRS